MRKSTILMLAIPAAILLIIIGMIIGQELTRDPKGFEKPLGTRTGAVHHRAGVPAGGRGRHTAFDLPAGRGCTLAT